MASNENPGAFLGNAAGVKTPSHAIAVGLFRISFLVGRCNFVLIRIFPTFISDPALHATLVFVAARLLGASNG
jgi:hypothetical protein